MRRDDAVTRRDTRQSEGIVGQRESRKVDDNLGEIRRWRQSHENGGSGYEKGEKLMAQIE